MIDPVNRASGTKSLASVGTPPAGVQAAPTASVAPATSESRAAVTARPIIAEMVDAGPPVDSARVAELRAAIAEGSYRIDPEGLAQAIIAHGQGNDNR